MTAFICCDDPRREAVRASAHLNGIDFLEVLDADAPTPADRQRILRLHFLKTPAPPNLQPANVVISGGERIVGAKADGVAYNGDVVDVHLDRYGDFSPYTLQLEAVAGLPFDASALDPLLSAVTFSFKVECPSDFDSAPAPPCAAPPSAPAPDIDYLAKDYTSFRQIMLDRLAALAPQWSERNPADLGVAMVEMLAYVGDQLSYRQDAVATEAYLGTARRRVSVRRHARLVDYLMHEGRNARAFVHFEVAADTNIPAQARLSTSLPGQGACITAQTLNQSLASPGVATFETLQSSPAFTAHNAMAFYAWGQQRCVLPKGATSATLSGLFPNLAQGAILIFEEIVGRRTGRPEDADPSRRCAVSLTKVTASHDPLGGAFASPPSTQSVDVTEIEWASDDALPFPICISILGARGAVAAAVARGNVALADHGVTLAADEDLGTVPGSVLVYSPASCDGCSPPQPKPVPPRYRPLLKRGPVAFAAPYDVATPPASAAAALAPRMAGVAPSNFKLVSNVGPNTIVWSARPDLLQSQSADPHFVIETEADASAWLRFGDDTHGRRPVSGSRFSARYRIGGGVAGNVAREAIRHVISTDLAIRALRNPLPATGGVDPEDIENVRRKAPFAFRAQARAVTPADYETLAETHPEVQRAAAQARWTGSWQTTFLTIERRGGLPMDADFATTILRYLEPYRLAGHDLEINGPNYVSLEIDAMVNVAPDYFRADVAAALTSLFSAGYLPDGRPAVFNPANFTFGQTVYLSPLYAAASQVAGVASLAVTTFQRQGQPSGEALAKGKLELGRFEIARLDNNPDFPERGVFRLTLGGGK